MVKKEKLQELVDEYGSLDKAAAEIGISKSGISRLITGERGIGMKSFKKLKGFCERKGLDINDYIFLD